MPAATGGRGLDVLVNAGTMLLGPTAALPDQRLRALFDVNLFGLLAVTRAFAPAMRERAPACGERLQHPGPVRLARGGAVLGVEVRGEAWWPLAPPDCTRNAMAWLVQLNVWKVAVA